MLPRINGKELFDCTEDDFCEIIDNLDYRENEYLDYKKTLDILSIPKDRINELSNSKAEFRSDVCSFANANGGYIIYGVEEDAKSVPKAIKGMSINNDDTDQFERDIKNWLHTISPRIPNYKISFVKLQNGNYVVILYIYHDYFAPYIHLEGDNNYRIYKRVGNSKVIVGYSELKNMFTNSLSLEKEVERFRRERIDYYRMQEDTEDYKYSKFMMLHIIPETFMDSNYNKQMYIIHRSQNVFSGLFSAFNCTDSLFPMIEGIRFTSYNDCEESRLFNNGIAECYYPFWRELNENLHPPYGYIPWKKLWDKIELAVHDYIYSLSGILDTQRLFVCISLIGFKGARTENNFYAAGISRVDRDYLTCNPIVINDFRNEDSTKHDIENLKIDYLLSLGIKYDNELKQLLDNKQ